jgi:hypothetical protein
MGFVQFPGSESEPATSGPGVAQKLAHVYKEYLAGFEETYVKLFAEPKRKIPMAGLPAVNRDPQELQMAISYAHLSGPELRSKGVPDDVIAFVENNRARLLSTSQLRQTWRDNLVGPSTAQMLEQDRIEPGGQQGQFPSQPNAATLQHAGARPPSFMSPQQHASPMSGGNGMDSHVSVLSQGPSLNAASSNQARRSNPEPIQRAEQMVKQIKHDISTRCKHSSRG